MNRLVYLNYFTNSYDNSYFHMNNTNDTNNTNDIEIIDIDTSEFDYPINDLEKQLSEYASSDTDYIEITVSDEEYDDDADATYQQRYYYNQPDIENALPRQIIPIPMHNNDDNNNNNNNNNNAHMNDYYDAIISYYTHFCFMSNLFNFDFRD